MITTFKNSNILNYHFYCFPRNTKTWESRKDAGNTCMHACMRACAHTTHAHMPTRTHTYTHNVAPKWGSISVNKPGGWPLGKPEHQLQLRETPSFKSVSHPPSPCGTHGCWLLRSANSPMRNEIELLPLLPMANLAVLTGGVTQNAGVPTWLQWHSVFWKSGVFLQFLTFALNYCFDLLSSCALSLQQQFIKGTRSE